MGHYAVKVEDLWKEYTVGAANPPAETFYDLLSGVLRSPFGGRARREEARNASRFWALRGLDFEIQPGEVFGVVGRNGAGKSTLLKLLSRITAPTRGRITVRGRIASLLEVGTGFHPELSGRENIYLNATILGMTRREIDRKMDAIVAFAGVERFLDTPVKRYSSGMYVRLAFAVAAHVEADILLVDEVLAVGDADFQKKCLGMMGDVARDGRTVLFVSHNLTALRNLCTTGVLLEGGAVAATGPIAGIIGQYTGFGDLRREVVFQGNASAEGEARLARVELRPADPDAVQDIVGSQGMSVTVDVEVASSAVIDVFIHCNNDQQLMVFSSGSFYEARMSGDALAPGMHRFVCHIPGHLLNDGQYTLDVMVVRGRQDVIASEQAVLSFSVADDFPVAEGWHWRPAGIVRPDLRWTREAISRTDRETASSS